MRTPFLYE